MDKDIKALTWIGTSKKDLLDMPDDVIDTFGYALDMAQRGRTHPQAKPLKGFGSAGVVEVVEDFDGDTYRAVYTVKIANQVFVLHCFKKKSKKGIATPKPDVDKIRDRLKRARELARDEEG